MSVESIKIIAAILSITGSGILAYRVTGILSALNLVAAAHELNIQQLMPGQQGDIYNVANSTKHIKDAQKKGLLILGFSFFILSGVLQLVALLMSNA